MAYFEIGEFCGECKRRRRKRDGAEWMSMPDARKTLERRKEKTGLIGGGVGISGVVVEQAEPMLNRFQQRAMNLYSKK